MDGLNKVFLLGEVDVGPPGKDTIHIKNFEDGNKVANFTLRVRERFTGVGGERREKKSWHRVSAWGNMAKMVETTGIQAGTALLVEGRISYSKSNDKLYTNINATNISIIKGLSGQGIDGDAGDSISYNISPSQKFGGR